MLRFTPTNRTLLLALLVCLSATLASASPIGDFLTKLAAEATTVWALAISLVGVIYAFSKILFSDHGHAGAWFALIAIVGLNTAARMVTWLQ